MLDWQKANKQALADEDAFQSYVGNYQPVYFSHKWYIQWQGSDAQEKLKKNLEQGLLKLMAKMSLYELQPEYYENFSLSQFCDRVA